MQNQLVIFNALLILALTSKLFWRPLYKYTKALPLAFILFLVFLKPGAWPLFWLLGICFGLAGDLLLLSRSGFLAGLFSFLLGHLCYIAGFYHLQGKIPHFTAVLPAALTALAGYTYLARLLIAQRNKKYLLPVLLYVAVTATLVVFALESRASSALWGAVLFAVSDFLLAFNKFARQTWYAEAGVSLTYYWAQWLLAVYFAGI